MEYAFEKSGKLKALTEEELQEADKDSTILCLQQGVCEDGASYWAYLSVKPSRYKALISVTGSHNLIRLEEYGEILCYGFDEEVPISVKEEMKQEYGCDDNFKQYLAAEVKKSQGVFLKDQEDKKIAGIVAMLKNK